MHQLILQRALWAATPRQALCLFLTPTPWTFLPWVVGRQDPDRRRRAFQGRQGAWAAHWTWRGQCSQKVFRAGSGRRASDAEGHELVAGPRILVHLQVMGNSGTLPSGLSPAMCGCQPGGDQGAQELLRPQAALLILASSGEGVGEGPTGLAGVKLPTLQSRPERLCC